MSRTSLDINKSWLKLRDLKRKNALDKRSKDFEKKNNESV